MVILRSPPLNNPSCPHFPCVENTLFNVPRYKIQWRLKLVNTSSASYSLLQLPYSHPHATWMVQALGRSALLRFTWPQQLQTQLLHLKKIEVPEYIYHPSLRGEDEFVGQSPMRNTL